MIRLAVLSALVLVAPCAAQDRRHAATSIAYPPH